MEKSWFIFQDDHHLGPFSTSEIRELLDQNEISRQAPLWKEGIDDWYPLEHYSDFAVKVEIEEAHTDPVVDDFPELPDLPDIPEVPDTPIKRPNVAVKEAITSISDFKELDFADDAEEIEQDEESEDLPELPDLPAVPEEVELVTLTLPVEVTKVPVAQKQKSETVKSKKVQQEANLEQVSTSDNVTEEILVKEVKLPPVENIVEEKSIKDGDIFLDEETIDKVDKVDKDNTADEQALDWNEIDQEKVRSKFNWKLWIAASICFITIVGTYNIFNFSSVSKDIHKGLLASQVEEILEIRSHSFSKNFQVKVFVSKNNKELILATNLPHEAKAYLTLSSVSKRVIGKGEVVVSANSKIQNGMAKFTKLSLIKGEKFLPGEYYVKVSTVPTGIREKVAKFLSSKLHIDILSPNQTHRYRGKDFIFQGTKEEFSHRLKAYFEKALEKKKTPYKDQLEKYRTFSQLSSRIFKMYQEVITAIRKGKDIESFELLYTKEAGPILQSLILDTHRLFKKFELSDPSVSSSYERVLEVGKKIGEMASDMVTMTQKKKRLRKKSRERLIKLFKKRSKYLSIEASGLAKDTEKLLKNLKL